MIARLRQMFDNLRFDRRSGLVAAAEMLSFGRRVNEAPKAQDSDRRLHGLFPVVP